MFVWFPLSALEALRHETYNSTLAEQEKKHPVLSISLSHEFRIQTCPAINDTLHTPDRREQRCQFIKGKAIPLQAWTGPEGSRRLRLPDFMTIGT